MAKTKNIKSSRSVAAKDGPQDRTAPTRKLKPKFYRKELSRLQIELGKLQGYVREKGLKVVVLFEGRDAAGKGGVIKRITEHLNPRGCSREAKYKAKQANDTFFVRFGDVLSAGLVFAGTTWFGFASREFALVNVALIAVWLVLAVVIGRLFKGMESKQSSETPSPAKARQRPVSSDSGVPASAPGLTPAPVVASVASP